MNENIQYINRAINLGETCFYVYTTVDARGCPTKKCTCSATKGALRNPYAEEKPQR